jgi:hypothetical protein
MDSTVYCFLAGICCAMANETSAQNAASHLLIFKDVLHESCVLPWGR